LLNKIDLFPLLSFTKLNQKISQPRTNKQKTHWIVEGNVEALVALLGLATAVESNSSHWK